jgi:hypothetical protein
MKAHFPRAPKHTFFVVAWSFAGCFPVLTLLCAVWWNMAQTSLPGGRHGPLDAYRHTLASAFLSRALGPWAVEKVSLLMESCTKRSCAMDRHNNAIGARLGLEAKAFSALPDIVLRQVEKGREGATDSAQTTWLPSSDWKSGFFW